MIECDYCDTKKGKCTHSKGDGICTLAQGYCLPSRRMREIDDGKEKGTRDEHKD